MTRQEAVKIAREEYKNFLGTHARATTFVGGRPEAREITLRIVSENTEFFMVIERRSVIIKTRPTLQNSSIFDPSKCVATKSVSFGLGSAFKKHLKRFLK